MISNNRDNRKEWVDKIQEQRSARRRAYELRNKRTKSLRTRHVIFPCDPQANPNVYSKDIIVYNLLNGKVSLDVLISVYDLSGSEPLNGVISFSQVIDSYYNRR